MKKRILILISIISLMLPVKVLAESGKIRASSNQSTVYLNNSFNVTVTVSSSGLLGSWQYNLTYDKDKLTLLSGNTSIADFGDGSSKTKTYSYSFRAIKEGKASIGVSSAKIADWQTESFIETSTGGTTVTISKPVNIVYSSNS